MTHCLYCSPFQQWGIGKPEFKTLSERKFTVSKRLQRRKLPGNSGQRAGIDRLNSSVYRFGFFGFTPWPRLDFGRLPGPVLIRLPGPVLSAGSFSRTAAGNRAYPWPFGRYVDTDVDKFASHFSRQSSGHGQKKNKCPVPLLGETLICQW